MENKHFFRVLPLAALALMMGACGNDEMENGMKDHVAGEFVPMTFTASMDIRLLMKMLEIYMMLINY